MTEKERRHIDIKPEWAVKDSGDTTRVGSQQSQMMVDDDIFYRQKIARDISMKRDITMEHPPCAQPYIDADQNKNTDAQ